MRNARRAARATRDLLQSKVQKFMTRLTFSVYTEAKPELRDIPSVATMPVKALASDDSSSADDPPELLVFILQSITPVVRRQRERTCALVRCLPRIPALKQAVDKSFVCTRTENIDASKLLIGRVRGGG